MSEIRATRPAVPWRGAGHARCRTWPAYMQPRNPWHPQPPLFFLQQPGLVPRKLEQDGQEEATQPAPELPPELLLDAEEPPLDPDDEAAHTPALHIWAVCVQSVHETPPVPQYGSTWVVWQSPVVSQHPVQVALQPASSPVVVASEPASSPDPEEDALSSPLPDDDVPPYDEPLDPLEDALPPELPPAPDTPPDEPAPPLVLTPPSEARATKTDVSSPAAHAATTLAPTASRARDTCMGRRLICNSGGSSPAPPHFTIRGFPTWQQARSHEIRYVQRAEEEVPSFRSNTRRIGVGIPVRIASPLEPHPTGHFFRPRATFEHPRGTKQHAHLGGVAHEAA